MGETSVFSRHSIKVGGKHGSGDVMIHIQLFVYLQLLDFLTTLVGLQFGLSEASPFIRMLMQVSPAAGLAVSKLLALTLGGVCIWLNKRHIVRWINYWYAGLIVWNICLIIAVRQAA